MCCRTWSPNSSQCGRRMGRLWCTNRLPRLKRWIEIEQWPLLPSPFSRPRVVATPCRMVLELIGQCTRNRTHTTHTNHTARRVASERQGRLTRASGLQPLPRSPLLHIHPHLRLPPRFPKHQPPLARSSQSHRLCKSKEPTCFVSSYFPPIIAGFAPAISRRGAGQQSRVAHCAPCGALLSLLSCFSCCRRRISRSVGPSHRCRARARQR